MSISAIGDLDSAFAPLRETLRLLPARPLPFCVHPRSSAVPSPQLTSHSAFSSTLIG